MYRRNLRDTTQDILWPAQSFLRYEPSRVANLTGFLSVKNTSKDYGLQLRSLYLKKDGTEKTERDLFPEFDIESNAEKPFSSEGSYTTTTITRQREIKCKFAANFRGKNAILGLQMRVSSCT